MGVVAHAAVPERALFDVRSGRRIRAIEEAREAVEAHPDDPDAFAVLGAAEVGLERYGDAVGAFAFAEGSALYERRGVGLHADALRATGQPRRAALLRMQRLLDSDADDGERYRVLLNLVDDHRAAGDPLRAEDFAWRAIAMRPEGPAGYAWLADTLVDEGRFDEASWYLFLADRFAQGQPLPRSHVARARMDLADGDLRGARLEAEAALEHHRQNARLRALLAEADRVAGLADEAAQVLDAAFSRWSLDPNILAIDARVRADLGDWSSAWDRLALAHERYPQWLDVKLSMEYVIERAHRAGRPVPAGLDRPEEGESTER